MKSHITDSSMFELWLTEKRNLAESSLYTYIQSLNRFLAINPDLDKLESYNDFLIKYTQKKRCSHYYSVLKGFIEFKITDGNLRNTLIKGLIKPPEHHDIIRERKHLTETQILEVINNLETSKHRIIALIQNLTGVRAGDILRLADGKIVPEIYKEKPTLRLNILGKYKRRNVVFVHDELAQKIIMNFITTNNSIPGYYFLEFGKMKGREGDVNNEGRLIRMNYLWYWQDLKKAIKTVGLDKEDFATHDFRRCYARRVWEKYKDLNVLQGLLNHADPKVTLRYLEQSGLKNIDYHYEMQS